MNRRIRRPERLLAGNVTTAPHPGFPTGLRAPYLVLLTHAHGTSIVRDENLFHHARELCHLEAALVIGKTTVWVKNPRPLTGTDVVARDLRGVAALVLAGLCAGGETVVSPIGHEARRTGCARSWD